MAKFVLAASFAMGAVSAGVVVSPPLFLPRDVIVVADMSSRSLLAAPSTSTSAR